MAKGLGKAAITDYNEKEKEILTQWCKPHDFVFDYFKRYTQVVYAGINAQVEQALYTAKRVLRGEVVRPETGAQYGFNSGAVVAYQFVGAGSNSGNDLTFLKIYYELRVCCLVVWCGVTQWRYGIYSR